MSKENEPLGKHENGNEFIAVVSTRSFNKLEMLAEDLECVKMWLDDKKAPKTDSDGNEYSVVGRIQCLLNVCQRIEAKVSCL